jgi:hypothetical protein
MIGRATLSESANKVNPDGQMSAPRPALNPLI